MAIFGVAFSPLQVSVGMQVTEGVLTQEYNPDTSEYMPDRRIRPAAVLPVVTVKDPSGLIADGVANHLLADIYWYEGEISDAKAILDSNQNYKIDRTSDNANRGRITVYKNVPFNNPLTLAFKATLVDMSGGKVRRKTPVAGSVVLSTSTAAVSPVVLIQGYPRGNFYNILDTMKHLKLSAKLMAGTEEVPSAMWWYKKEGAKLTEITDYVGAKTGELQVPVADIGRLSKYVVKAQDCRKDLQALRDEWLDDELEKIRDYPRNLIAKQYLMDWNEVQAGITTKGEDGDGEYLQTDFSLVRRYVTGNNDISDAFQGKISFQPNTQYVIKVKWKKEPGKEGRTAGFVIVYTDGTMNKENVSADSETLAEYSFTTAEGKSIKNIGMTYGYPGYVRIYEISLTEYGGAENLIEDSGEIRVTSSESSIYSNVKRSIPGKYAAGDKFTVNVGSIENLAGSAVEYSVFLYQEAEGGVAYVSNSKLLSKEGRIAVFTLNDSYNPDVKLLAAFYAGKAGETAGNDVAYRNLMLVEGEYTSETMPAYCPKWIPAAADLAAEAEQVQLPAEYRPATQGETEDGEYDLGMRMPNYTTRVVTPWGDDKEVVMIPPGVKLFPAWIQVDTPQGTLEEPEKYFSADWGNGLKGMQVLLDAEQIGTGTMVVEPEVHEDLSMARYGAGGTNGDATKLEAFEEGMRFVFEVDDSTDAQNNYSCRLINSQSEGVAVMASSNNGVYVYIIAGGKRSIVSVPQTNHLRRVEIVVGDLEDLTTWKAYADGVAMPAFSTGSEHAQSSNIRINSTAICALMEAYSPDGTLLHKWDFEGSTDEERMSDKATTDNPINLTKANGFKLTPI